MSRDFRQRFRSSGDASMRHRGTYMGLRDSLGIIQPIYIEGVGGDSSNPTLEYSNVLNGNHESVRMNDPRLVIERPELGMGNLECRATRKTVALWHEGRASRQVKRSLSFDIIKRDVICKEQSRYFSTSIDTSSRQGKHSTLSNMFNNHYPTYSRALGSIVSGDAISIAFCKKFALANHPQYGVAVYYKTKLVGLVPETLPVLFEQYEYLTEILEELSHGYA